MPIERLQQKLAADVREMQSTGRAKGAETVFSGVLASSGANGPRYLLAGEGQRAYLRMNSNSYLGMSLNADVRSAEEQAVRAIGAGPGALRFISGTWAPHTALEQRLARFHSREAAMIYSSAYATVMGVLPQLIDSETVVISDALNHSCIINAVRLSRPKEKRVYPHLDLAALDRILGECAETCRRAVVITDGIFSMRGDHAPLDEIMALAQKHDSAYAENVIVAADDSHGVGAFGETGRGTEEYCAAPPVDVLIGTLGKAFGVNGGYVTGSATLIDYLRETSPFYIYSNPITPGEAAAALRAVEIVDSQEGRAKLAHLRAVTARFEAGLVALGFETIAGAHPVVPLMVRDTATTSALVAYLRANAILATGLNFPVVPKGDEEIRFQISADHTAADIDAALSVLAAFAEQQKKMSGSA
ncbi:MAG: aminotransferase class I/II-fold pyridoxal phosphate-dependent enzyme [Proteobacteria bacterium]|nr:aminotransferase class I/II-fold pyridoxal phosphate-dependent enzyme [Pseudomonadota bacterium]MDA1355141.1 aminotransferase class I/II-fold pyridoxal phosphate-dependent enzyme [Pseudomonadota bacterium]